MRILPLILAFLSVPFALPPALAANPVQTKHVTAVLVTEHQALLSGTENQVGIRLEMIPEWHTYWRYPGDSGLPTEVTWHLPAGWAAGSLEWPVPKRIFVPPLVNYGYSGEALLGARLRVPKGASGVFTLGASVSWLVCKEECVPEKAELSLQVTAGSAAARPGPLAREFAQLRGQQPPPSELPARALVRDHQVGIEIEDPGHLVKDNADYFPLSAEIVKGDAAPRVEHSGSKTILWLEKSDPFDLKARSLAGMLVQDGGNREVSALLSEDHSPPAAVAAMSTALPRAPEAPASGGPWFLVLSALLGGLILNLMPCVFPVLGIKVMSLVRQSGSEQRHARVHGQAYAAGVVICFWLLAGGLLALRSAGRSVGWGFQLQDPGFVTILILLFTFVAADLAGFIHWSGRWMGAGSGLAQREGLAGSFFTGVLAVVVATPCTAPFMGTAIGAAIGEPGWVVFLVFTALGLGLALPFLVLCYHPAYLKVLPKPGAWMERLKELFAFPIAATVLWLLWVLTLQVGPEGALKVETGLLVLILADWARRRFAGGGARIVSYLLFALGIFICVTGARSASTGIGMATEGAWKPYSEAAVSEAMAARKPVFVDFTAAWCLTCQVNKKLVLDRAAMQAYFREKGVALFLADWTNRDPAITKALEREGRLGVPLYLAYHAGDAQPTVLPQILTEDQLRTFFP